MKKASRKQSKKVSRKPRRKQVGPDAVASLQGQPVLVDFKANPSRYSRPAKF